MPDLLEESQALRYWKTCIPMRKDFDPETSFSWYQNKGRILKKFLDSASLSA